MEEIRPEIRYHVTNNSTEGEQRYNWRVVFIGSPQKVRQLESILLGQVNPIEPISKFRQNTPIEGCIAEFREFETRRKEPYRKGFGDDSQIIIEDGQLAGKSGDAAEIYVESLFANYARG